LVLVARAVVGLLTDRHLFLDGTKNGRRHWCSM
jgi:predicted RNA-binding Zn ribbon-like protein